VRKTAPGDSIRRVSDRERDRIAGYLPERDYRVRFIVPEDNGRLLFQFSVEDQIRGAYR